jgi:tetratricopeptide (TPR) repeat protein
MRRRITAEPQRMVHYQGWVSWLYRHKHFTEAREVCVRCLEGWPDHWWPTVMLSMIDARLGAFDEAEERLVRFTEKRAEFNVSFLLVQFYFQEGMEEKACEALKGALNLPIRHLDNKPYNLYSSDQPRGMMAHRGPWKAALLAYQVKRYDLALAICARWERFREEATGVVDASFYTIRAACYLAQGEFERAQMNATKMIEVSRGHPQFGDNVEALMDAIERGDRTFVYATDERPLQMLLDYE